MTNRQRIWTAGLAAALVAGVVLVATSVLAQEVVAIDTVHRGDPGDLFHEGTVEAVGACTATLRYTNNESQSEHPDTDILVGPITFTDVEHGAFVEAGLTFTGTGTTDVTTRIGGDGISSGGFTLEVTCNPPTTTIISPPTSTIPTTTVPSITVSTLPVTTTTLSEPPVGGISTGGGACADGSCSSLSPLATWILLGVVWSLLAGLAWAFIHGATRRSDG